MIYKNYILFYLFLAVLICNVKTAAQDTVATAPEFLVGTFVHLSDDPEYTWYNYDSVLALGVNSVLQLGIKDVPRLNQDSNLEELTVFPTVYAANDSGTGTGAYWIDAEPENIDWISYFTQAKYRKWEAEGSDLFQNYVKIKYQGGEPYLEPDGTEGWKTNNQSQSEDSIVYGPHYWQYPRYTFTNPSWNPDSIIYKAIFRLKIDSIPVTPQDVCRIMVTSTDSTGYEDTLAIKLLKTSDFVTGYNNFPLRYSYSGFYDQPPVNYNYPPLPGTNDSESGYGYNQGSKVQFKVVWEGYRELFVDYIEVYDEKIWEEYFKLDYALLINRISTYDQEFATQNPTFYEKLKYYTTMDEPGSIDCYEPLRKVQFILDSLNISADLLTHWYPGWNGRYEGNGWDPSLPVYNQLAQPKKLYFWYAPFTITSSGVPDPRDFTLFNLRKNLQWAHLKQPDFYIAPQTFGIKEPNGDWFRWMTPDTAEVGAETMLSLAHGVEGIYYELYYSYHSGVRKVEGLVNFPPDYEPRDIWYKVQEIASRLRGTLGKTLMTLDYRATDETDGFLRLYPYATTPLMVDVITNTTETKYYLTLSKTTQNPIPPPLNFHAGFFDHPTQTENNYFLLANLITTDGRWVNVGITDMAMKICALGILNRNTILIQHLQTQYRLT